MPRSNFSLSLVASWIILCLLSIHKLFMREARFTGTVIVLRFSLYHTSNTMTDVDEILELFLKCCTTGAKETHCINNFQNSVSYLDL